MNALGRTLTPGLPANRLLRFALAVLALTVELIGFRELWLLTGHGIDLEIPLRAAQRS